MRYSPSEKLEIIRIVEDSELSVRRTLKELGIHCSTFYNWYRRYLEDSVEGLGPKQPKARTFWNKIPEEVKEQVVEIALEETNLYPESWPVESPILMSTSSQNPAFIGFSKPMT
jgi:putative transposase